MEKNNCESTEVRVLDSRHMQCTNYLFGALQEGGLVLQAKESEKIIEQIVAVTEFWVNQSGLSVNQSFTQELFQVGQLSLSYAGTCEAIAIEMLSDESYRIRIFHTEKQEEVYIALPLVSTTSLQKESGHMLFCFRFFKVEP